MARGNIFEREISDSLRADNFHFIKIATTSAVGFGDVSGRFMKSPPYDYFAVRNVVFGIEAKSWKGPVTSLAFSRVKSHQEAGMLDLGQKGLGNAFGVILLNIRNPKNRCFLVKIEDWLELKNKLPRKSVPIAYVEDKPFWEIKKVKRSWTTEKGTQKTGLIWDFYSTVNTILGGTLV
jgi:penicillin-binding protein-related factor A (putative recombinase)